MHDIPTVNVPIPVEPDVAAVLGDACTHAAMGRLVGRVLRPRSGSSALAQAITDAKVKARASCLPSFRCNDGEGGGLRDGSSWIA